MNKVYTAVSEKVFTFIAKKQCLKFGRSFSASMCTQLTKNTVIGDNVSLKNLKVKGHGKLKIGNNFHSGIDCLIHTSIHDYDHGNTLPYGIGNIMKPVTIEDNVWFGSRVIITGGCRIGEGAIIQAGAVVVSDVPALSIAGGNPAKVFKTRDSDHYFLLKKAKKFI